MVLSGLILLPLFALPTLFFLKKDFQIKAFYSMVALIHFTLSLAILSKHGYFFQGKILAESVMLKTALGLNYSVSIGAAGLAFITLISFLFLIIGSMSLKENVKVRALALLILHSLALFTLASTNTLASVCSIFMFSIVHMLLKANTKDNFNFKYPILFLGFAFALGVSLILGILYESIYGYANMDINSLSEMRTPFVRGSLYSTQLVLFAFYCLGFLLILISNLIECWGLLKTKETICSMQPIIAVALSCYIYLSFVAQLFPEAKALYLPPLQILRAGASAIVLFLVCLVFFRKLLIVLSERRNHV